MRSCRDCLAWGVTGYSGVCLPCRRYAHTYRIGVCGSCGREVALRGGHCRLCWVQAQRDRPFVARHTVLAPHVRQVRAHQLFFTGMDFKPRADRVVLAREQALPYPAMPARRSVRTAGTQLWLFEGLARRYRYGQIDLRREPVPDKPVLHDALAIAARLAETRGWNDVVLDGLNRILVMLLAPLHDGEQVRYSDYAPLLRAHCGSLRRTTEVLAAVGVLLDDRVPTIQAFIERQLPGLAAGIATDTRGWALALAHGDDRTRRRDPGTVRNYLRAVTPILRTWSRQHLHLREVTRPGVDAAVAELRGHARVHTLVALRSLFGWAKRTGTIFTNPTAGMRVGPPPRPLHLPLPTDALTDTFTAGATSVQARVFLVLAAVHAARPGQVRHLMLSNVDLDNRRLTVAGRERPLDELTHQVLRAWLDYRRERWPATSNPHLMISRASALDHAPVSEVWIELELRGLPATLDRIRRDRHLEEALAHGPDPLHLREMFGLNPATAIHYARSARALLAEPSSGEASARPRASTPPRSS